MANVNWNWKPHLKNENKRRILILMYVCVVHFIIITESKKENIMQQVTKIRTYYTFVLLFYRERLQTSCYRLK